MFVALAAWYLYFGVLVLFAFESSKRTFDTFTILGTVHRLTESFIAIALAAMIDQRFGIVNLTKWLLGKKTKIDGDTTYTVSSSSSGNTRGTTMQRTTAEDSEDDLLNASGQSIEEEHASSRSESASVVDSSECESVGSVDSSSTRSWETFQS